MEDEKRLLELLEGLGKEARRQGSYRRLSLHLDRHPGWFSKVMSRQTPLSARDLFDVLEKLGLRPAVFFRSLYRGARTRASQVLDYLKEDDGRPPSEFLSSVADRVEEIDWSDSVSISAETVAMLEALRVTPDPAASLPRVEVLSRAAMQQGHPEEFLATLNVWSSLTRELGRRTDAAKACIIAFELVERNLDVGWLEGWLFQRSSYLLRDAQRLAEAEDFLREAADIFLLNGESERFWSTYSDRGALYWHMGNFQRSRLSYEVALRYLPVSQVRRRVGCHQGLALALVGEGKLDAADRALANGFAELDRTGGQVEARLLWCQGSLRIKQKKFEEAERSLTLVFEIFGQTERPIDRALVAVDLASLYLSTGEEEKLRRLVSEVFRWLPIYGQNPVAQAAIADLFRKGIAGELTHEVCRRVRLALKEPAPLKNVQRRQNRKP